MKKTFLFIFLIIFSFFLIGSRGIKKPLKYKFKKVSFVYQDLPIVTLEFITNSDAVNKFTNYPNPFNSSTNINYELFSDENVTIKIYNILGEVVIVFDLGVQSLGKHSIIWNGKNQDGGIVSSGIYFCQLRTEKFNRVIKINLIK